MKGPTIDNANPSLALSHWLALDYAICVASCWAKDGKIYIEPLDLEVAEIESAFEPTWIIRGHDGAPRFSGFRVLEIKAPGVVQLFDRSPKAARRIGEKLAVCYSYGNPLPTALRDLGRSILSGDKRFTKAKAAKPTMKHRDTLLAGLAKVIHAETDLPLANNAATLEARKNRPLTASALAGAALASVGVAMTLEIAAKVCRQRNILINNELLAGPAFVPHVAPRSINALAGRLHMFDTTGKDHLRDAALKWLMLHL